MLLLTRKQFHLNFIQVYLQEGQSIFQNRPHQLIAFSWIRPVHLAQTRLFLPSQPQWDSEKATAKVALKVIRTLQRQQFYLGVTAPNICA